ncbi:MAG: 2-oxoacid:acceptor oxidoreductase [Sphaerochaetaceae bacterium]|nr:2-oxoacid:acceptor oxidoreductase [Sphaerochaetaceae bacterium]
MKRNDATQVYDIPVYNKIFPFLLKRRSDSLVFHSFEMDVTNTLEYIRKYNAKKPEFRMRFFYVFCAALLRTFVDRPELNRFIAGKRYWQRNELSMNFVVKEKMTDEAPETSNPLYFKEDMVLYDMAKILDDYINRSKEDSTNNSTDSLISLIMHVPTWLIALFVKILGGLDARGNLPKAIRDADGLHTSMFVSNLGSIGIEGPSPLHHLYEWGTTSLFITLGALERRREFDDEGKVKSCKNVVRIGFTVDERITSGFYFIKSIKHFQSILENPEVLETPPEKIFRPITKKEYKKNLKLQKSHS